MTKTVDQLSREGLVPRSLIGGAAFLGLALGLAIFGPAAFGAYAAYSMAIAATGFGYSELTKSKDDMA